MLIINADDWGYDREVTDRIASCYEKGRITSTSAMVLMEDSERAAAIALGSGLEVGLHLNFTERFTGLKLSSLLEDTQQRIASYLLKSKYSLVLYNHFLKKEFDYVYRMQYDEFVKLYGKVPSHVNGHHHMHLCTNMLIDGLIPANHKVRKSFSFLSSEKSAFNRFYRCLVDMWLKRRYVCTDYFFSIAPIEEPGRLRRIIKLSQSCNVELMVHPQKSNEYEYLMGSAYAELIGGADIGTFGAL